MGEHGIDEMVGIACDGFGYGVDGEAWGGEILHVNADGFQRLGHLQKQPLIGGDLATRYPLRILAGMLHQVLDIDEWLLAKSRHFPHGKKEVGVVLKQLKGGGSLTTTSCGRVLDAVAALLGICYDRTYEGEPAMKLEAIASQGKDVLQLDPEITGTVLNTTTLVRALFDLVRNYPVADLACSAQSYLARGIAQLAMTEAERLTINAIGFSGGVAYNEHLTMTLSEIVRKNGFEFYLHNSIPPGDGGIAFGQAYTASRFTE
jgi:hydrogenase maturation protein HypF